MSKYKVVYKHIVSEKSVKGKHSVHHRKTSASQVTEDSGSPDPALIICFIKKESVSLCGLWLCWGGGVVQRAVPERLSGQLGLQETEGRAVRGTRPLQSCTKQSEKIKHCNKTSPTLQQRIRVGSFVSHKVLCLILKVDEASVSWLQTGNLFHRRGTYTYSFLKGLYK